MKRSTRSFLTILALCALCSFAVNARAQLFSQNKPEAIATAKADLAGANAVLAQQLADAQAKLAAAQAAGNTAQAEATQKMIDSLTKVLSVGQKAQAVAEIATNPDGTINEQGLVTLGGYLPFPFNVIVLIGGPVLFREWQAWQTRKALAAATAQAEQAVADSKSIVNGIDALRIASPVVATEMAKAASTSGNFTDHFTPGAAALIEAERLT